MQYFLNIGGQLIGPMNAHQVMAYNVNPNVSVSTDGKNWAPLYNFPELMEIYNRSNNVSADRAEVESKKTLCGIMAILFGYLGVQYFILGKVGGGFITILLTCVTCGLWSLLTLVQGILMLTMSDSEFKQKYIDSTSVLPLF